MIQLTYAFQGAHLLPLCDLVLLGRSRRVPVQALIDSGAVFSVFPRQTAEDAEIDLPLSPSRSVIFGGSVAPAWEIDVNIEIKGHRLSLPVRFVERLEFPYALLGRYRFFSRFREVAFLEKQRTPRVELR